jgi:hypothetical protein
MTIEKQIEEMGASGYTKLAWKLYSVLKLPMAQCEAIDSIVREQGYVKRNTGKWIIIGEPLMTDECRQIPVECSCCAIRRHIPHVNYHGYSFCPNCGAKMKV